MKNKIIAILILVSMTFVFPGLSFADTERTNDISEAGETETNIYINPVFSDIVSESDVINGIQSKPKAALMASASNEFISDERVIAETLRTAMENRQDDITINYASKGPVDESTINNWIEMALEETDSPTQGDYLRFVLGGSACEWEYYYEGDTCFNVIDVEMFYYTSLEQEHELTNEVNKVLNSFAFNDSTSDYNKIEKIYDYICSNITYDYENLNDNEYKLKYTAYAALMNKTAVCQGYATLMYRMLEACGIDSRIITGVSHGENHAWNIAKLYGKYYYLDSTWDAGVDKYSYFLKGTDSFPDHQSSEAYLRDDFVNKYVISGEEYMLPGADVIISGGFKYLISSGEAKLVKYTGNDTEVVVPASIEGYPVTTIGISAFKNASFEKLTLSEGITTLEQESIFMCESLKEINLPASLVIPVEKNEGCVSGITCMPNYCRNLERINVAKGSKSLVDVDGVLFDKDMTSILFYPSGKKDKTYAIPNGILSIGSSSFEGNGHIENISMPDSVILIGYWAFSQCSQLRDINISNNCQVIGQFAFKGTAIRKMTVPAKLVDIGSPFGDDCMHLEEWVVDSNNPVYCSYEGVQLNKDMTKVFNIPAAKDGELVLPESVMSIIADSAVQVALSSITIPAGATVQKGNFIVHPDVFTIYGYEGSSAQEYAQLNNLNFVSAGEIVENVIASGKCGKSMKWSLSNRGFLRISGTGEMSWDSAFSPWDDYRDQIRKVIIEEGVENVSDNAFSQNTALKEVELPNSLRTIGSFAFSSCDSIKKIVIPDGVRELGDGAFDACKISEIRLPKSLSSIGNSAFLDCPLDDIYLDHDNQYFTVYDGALFDKDMTTLIVYPSAHKDYCYVPDGVEVIGECAFWKSEIQNIYLPDSVKTIERNAFGNARVENIYLGDNITTIKRDAFYSCQGLSTIVLGKKLKTIGSGASVGLYSIKTVYYLGTNDTWKGIRIGDRNTQLLGADLKCVSKSDLCSQGIHFFKYNERKEGDCFGTGHRSHYHCLRCGKNYYEYGWKIDNSTPVIPDNEIVLPVMHSFGGWEKVTANVCGNSSFSKHVCRICGFVETEIPEPDPHDWSSEYTTDIAPTCTKNGIETIHCNKCSAVKDCRIIPANGHDWGEPVYTWSSDYSKVTAKRTCKTDSSHVEKETVATKATVTKKATYTSKGNTTYTASFKNAAFSTKKKTVANIPKLAKKANTIKVKTKTQTIKATALKKKAKTITAKKALTITKAKGKLTYRLTSVTKTKFKKYFTIKAKSGLITVKKGLRKGTYKLRIKVTAAGTTKYKSGSKTVTLTIKVK